MAPGGTPGCAQPGRANVSQPGSAGRCRSCLGGHRSTVGHRASPAGLEQGPPRALRPRRSRSGLAASRSCAGRCAKRRPPQPLNPRKAKPPADGRRHQSSAAGRTCRQKSFLGRRRATNASTDPRAHGANFHPRAVTLEDGVTCPHLVNVILSVATTLNRRHRASFARTRTSRGSVGKKKHHPAAVKLRARAKSDLMLAGVTWCALRAGRGCVGPAVKGVRFTPQNKWRGGHRTEQAMKIAGSG